MGVAKVGFEVVIEREMPKNPVLIVGLPDAGLVGAISSSFLVRALELEEVAFLDSPGLPPIVVFHNSEPTAPVRIHAKDATAVLLSEIAIPPGLFRYIAERVVELAREIEATRLIMLGGIPVPNRMDVEKPKVYGSGSLDSEREYLRKNGIELFKEGFVAGVYASILKESIKRKFPAIILLAESHLNYPDPGAAASAIETLSKLLGFEVDVGPLLKQEEEIRLKLRELMKRTVDSMKAAGKEYEFSIPLMYA